MENWLKSHFGSLKDVKLHIQLRRLRWMVFPLMLILSAFHQFVLYLLTDSLPISWNWWIQLLIYSISGSIAVWLGLTWLSNSIYLQFEAEESLRLAFEKLDQNHRQLLALNKFGEHITAADDQHAILELAARAPLELTGAQASTVLTFDDDKDRLKLDIAWGLSDNYLNALRYRIDKGLSSSRCQMCNSLKTHLGSDCPLFDGLEPVARNDGIQSLICMPVNHEDERIGIISAYFPSDEGPPEDHIRLLRILGGVIATAIENIRSREREIETLYAIDQVADYSHKDENRAVGEMAQKVLEITVVGWGAQYGGLFLLDEHDLKWTLIAK